jgi:hypothetical protein
VNIAITIPFLIKLVFQEVSFVVKSLQNIVKSFFSFYALITCPIYQSLIFWFWLQNLIKNIHSKVFLKWVQNKRTLYI